MGTSSVSGFNFSITPLRRMKMNADEVKKKPKCPDCGREGWIPSVICPCELNSYFKHQHENDAREDS